MNVGGTLEKKKGRENKGRWEREESNIGTWILIQELWEELGQDMDIQS